MRSLLHHTAIRRTVLLASAGLTAALAYSAATSAAGGAHVPTTRRDFFEPGTRPGTLEVDVIPSGNCAGCHGYFDETMEPYRNWVGSMMAQATRDPIFHAALAVAEQDAANSGELCLRCHAPGAWLAGRGVPTDGSGLDETLGDYDGVTCHFCHRMVDPIYDASANPPVDAGILANLTSPPVHEVHSGQFVVDPKDRRRGPFDLGTGFGFHAWLQSPFHRESLLCGTCHDVSNPVLERQPDGSFLPGALDRPHPTHDKRDEFPIERTFSEWTLSVFAQAPIEKGGRFGVNKSAVATCQDCHLPAITGTACIPGMGVTRDDMPLHELAGANSWVLRAVRALFPDWQTGLDSQIVDKAIAANVSMLQRAADLDVFERNGELVVRIVNHSGHKLPTGYGEGRRMWLNLRFLDAQGNLLLERGAYDPGSATLDANSTRVWQVEHAIDDAMSQILGLPPGPSFHFVLNNSIALDNRIPPRGFQRAAFAAVGAPAIGTSYLDQQCWDEQVFPLPAGTSRVEARLYHQTTTREYIEFLRDENHTNAAGQVAYRTWLELGKSEPVEMRSLVYDLALAPAPEPVLYGLGDPDAGGTRAEIGIVGRAQLAAGTFRLTCTGAAAGQSCMLIEGTAPAGMPYANGRILVANRRLVGQTTIASDGTAALDLTVTPPDVGKQRFYQFVFRDPARVGQVGMTDALLVDYTP